MIYGRRFFQKTAPSADLANPLVVRRRLDIKGSSYRSFRGKYLLFLILAVLGSLAIFFVPTAYFVTQNYDIFKSLAYDTQPELLNHLEREFTWIMGFLSVSILALGAFCFWIGFKVTRAIITPLHAIEVHMKKATLGDWTSEEFKTQETDDLRSLIDTYNYLYRTIRAQAESDIRYLQKIVVDPAQREAYQTLQMLIESKKEQLGMLQEEPHTVIQNTISAIESKKAS